MSDGPEYGPSGYLPDRAARRARKIVLREPLGKGWIIASVLGAVAILLVGVAYFLTQVGPPGDPYRDVGLIADIDARGAETVAVDGPHVLVVRGAGGVQAFEAPAADTAWCRESRRIEASDGRVWDASGRLRGGDGESLRPLRVEAHDGRLYVDTETELERPAERPAGEEPLCLP